MNLYREKCMTINTVMRKMILFVIHATENKGSQYGVSLSEKGNSP